MRLVTINDIENLKYTLKGNPLIKVVAVNGKYPTMTICYHKQHRRRVNYSKLKPFLPLAINTDFKRTSHKNLREIESCCI